MAADPFGDPGGLPGWLQAAIFGVVSALAGTVAFLFRDNRRLTDVIRADLIASNERLAALVEAETRANRALAEALAAKAEAEREITAELRRIGALPKTPRRTGI